MSDRHERAIAGHTVYTAEWPAPTAADRAAHAAHTAACRAVGVEPLTPTMWVFHGRPTGPGPHPDPTTQEETP